MLVIGELINGMYKNVRKAIKDKDKKTIQDLAKRQSEAGASFLDVNTGPVEGDPKEVIAWLVETIQEVVDVPLCLDSTKAEVIETGLKMVRKKAIINSTNADEERLNILVEMALKYKASLIALTMDKKGVPRNKEERLELALKIVSYCQDKGLSLDELFIDPVVLPVNVAQAQSPQVIQTIREIELLSRPAPQTIVGLSNISQGTQKRELINRTYLVMLQANGLKAAICDPLDKNLMDAIITADLLLNKNIYCDSFLQAYKNR
jgi:5-methyltetrahydrofolate corrinoid/iron sulfur protein methyltransferase